MKEIPLSKRKLTILLIGALTLVLLSMGLLVEKPELSSTIIGNVYLVLTIGWAGLIFFGLIAAICIQKLVDTKMGLVISDKGVNDNSSGLSLGLIRWSDIVEFKKLEKENQKFVLCVLKNPDNYIAKVSNVLKRKSLQLNQRLYGTPVPISSQALQIEFDELYLALNKGLTTYKTMANIRS